MGFSKSSALKTADRILRSYRSLNCPAECSSVSALRRRCFCVPAFCLPMNRQPRWMFPCRNRFRRAALLRKTYGTAIVLVAHNIGVIGAMADRYWSGRMEEIRRVRRKRRRSCMIRRQALYAHAAVCRAAVKEGVRWSRFLRVQRSDKNLYPQRTEQF